MLSQPGVASHIGGAMARGAAGLVALHKSDTKAAAPQTGMPEFGCTEAGYGPGCGLGCGPRARRKGAGASAGMSELWGQWMGRAVGVIPPSRSCRG